MTTALLDFETIRKNSMKPHQFCVWLVLTLLVLTPLNNAYSAESLADTYGAPAPVSLKTLASKIKDAEANTDLDEATKTRLLEIYRKTIRHLEEMHTNNAATDTYIRSRKTDPEQAKRIREKLEKRKTKASAVTAEIFSAKTPFAEMEQLLFTEKANLAAVKAKLSDLEQQLTLAAVRPNAVRQQLIETRRNQEDITSQLLQPIAKEEQPLLVEAMQWKLGTRRLALRTEIGMLDQELLSLPMRIDLLEAGRASKTFTVEQLTKRVASAQGIVNQQQQVEAEKAKAEAEKTRHELEGKHPLIRQLAGRNAALTDELSQLTSEFERVTRGSDTAKKDNERITNEFRGVRRKLEVGGFGRVLGQVLIEKQRQLPNLGRFRKRATARADRIADVGLQLLEYSEEYRELTSLTGYVDQLVATLPEQEAGQIRADLEKLAVSRQNMLKRLINLSRSSLRSLSDFEFSDRALLSTIQDYQSFLDQHLLWLRSGPLPSLASLQEMPSQLVGFVSPARWRKVASVLEDQATRSPFLVLGLIVVAVLLWKTKSWRSALRETGANIGKISKDSIAVTFYALGLTLLLAASWPLLLAVFGWQLRMSPQVTAITNDISYALLWISVYFLGFRVFRVLCEPDGVAAAHFHVPETTVQLLHRELGRLMVILLPSAFIFVLLFHFDLAIATGEAGRFFVAVILIAIAVFFYRIPASKQSLLRNDQAQYADNSWIIRWQCWWRPLLVAIPLILVGFDFIGYTYMAAALTLNLINTLWFILVLIVVKQVVFRWLLLTQRRLALQAALEKRAAAKAKKEAESLGQSEIESESGEVEEPEIDLVALSQESRQLLQVALMLLGILGLLLIWANILPAFGLLNDITIWSYTAVVSGEQQLIPVTLLDLGLAGLIIFVTVVFANYLPSLLEIIMLQRTALSAGSRYTVTTIASYVIVAVGMILFFNTIGVDWSKVQWLVAALGVGIGFGLQEIVANFISGIIILFERPIRVGDIVSIGNNEGTVVRIRIRATTIRNWDRKELLVPNKEFITGQLINWTLSDPMTRIVIPVGLAYGGDVELALKIMLEAAEEYPDVLSDPGSSVVFDEFGDNALSLKLRCFVADIDSRIPTITALHKAINRKFNDAGLVIAFPQRDVHLDTHAPLDIRIRRE